MSETADKTTSSGIETLIARLREEGVDEGRAEAERLIEEAEARARRIVEAAEAEAAAKRKAVEADAQKLKHAGEAALKIAMRDAVLELKEGLSERFAERVQGVISAAMTQDDQVLKDLILAVASRSREDGGMDAAREIQIILPRSAVGLDDLRRNPEELRDGTLTHFVATVAADMLRDGVSFDRAQDEAAGIRVRLVDDGIVVDVTDRAAAAVILRHLQPRFRALLESVVG